MRCLLPCLSILLLFLFQLRLEAQVLEGRIFHAQSGETLPLATFQVQGQGRGAVSDVDGEFRYDFRQRGLYTVHISFMGFEPYSREISIQGDTSIDFYLQPSTSTLAEVVVTGTRTPKLLKDVPVPTTLIQAREIEQSGAVTFTDLLETEIPGIEFKRDVDGQMVVNMQGMGGTDVLFLVDGQRLAGESMNNIDYERLDLSNVERVEIVRGAGSALYGSNATGGVVNIITKETRQPWDLRLDARYGSANEQKYSANFGFNQGRWNGNTSLSYRSIDTYTLQDRDSSERLSYIFGGKTYNVGQNLRVRLAEGMYLKAKGGFYFRERDFSPTLHNRYMDGSSSLEYTYQIDSQASFRASYAFDQYDKFNFYPKAGLQTLDYRNVQHTFSTQFNYSFLRAGTLSTGLEYFNESLLSSRFDTTAQGDFRSYVSHTAVAFAQHDISWHDRYFLVYGLRMDYNTRFRLPHLSPKLSFMYKIRPVSLRFSYAGGFRTPTLKELFSDYDMGGQGWFILYGNPDLKPEKSQNLMFSLEYSRKAGSFTANAFYNYTTDKITTVYNAAQDTAFYRNVNRSHTAGFDASLMLKIPYGFGLKLSYSYVYDLQREQGLNVSSARPHTGVARFSYDWGRPNYALSVVLSGRVLSGLTTSVIDGYENGQPVMGQVSYPAYTLWKIQLSQRIYHCANLSLGVDNIFNYRPVNYDLVSSVSPGTTFYVSLSLDIDAMTRIRRL